MRRIAPVVAAARAAARFGAAARSWAALGLAGLAAAALFTGCGGDDGPDRLVISAASSLTAPLSACSPEGARLSFAGSDELAAQIRRGVKPDVFAAANAKLPEELERGGFVEAPRVFATNRLVIAVPRSSGVRSIGDLAEPGLKLAVGAPTVPVGAYTHDVLGRLPASQRAPIERNVRSREPDVRGVVGKVVQGAADAGFVYASDVTGARDRLRAIELPAELRPTVEYQAALIKGAGEAARGYLDDLVEGDCQEALQAAGFGPSEAVTS